MRQYYSSDKKKREEKKKRKKEEKWLKRLAKNSPKADPNAPQQDAAVDKAISDRI